MEQTDPQTSPDAPASQPETEKRPYQAPRVESVELSKEAAESLT